MRSEEYGEKVADIIVSENGTLVAEDIWYGFDEGAMEAISDYLEENGATVYDMTELPQNAIISLNSGQTLRTEKHRLYRKITGQKRWLEKTKLEKRYGLISVQSVRLYCQMVLR